MSPHDTNKRFPTFARMGRRLVKALKVLGKGLIALAIIGFVAHGIASVIEGRKLTAKIEALKASGEFVPLADTGKPKVPDAENAALVYEEIFRRLPEPNGEELSPVSDLLPPTASAVTAKQWADAEKVLGKYASVFPLIEQAASKSRCQFPVRWEQGFEAEFPHLAELRTLARLAAAHALVQARNGDMPGAIHSVEQGFAVAEALKDEPCLISQLTRITMIHMQSSVLRQILVQGNVSEAQAKHTYDLLGGIDLMSSYVRAMQTDRAFGMWCYDYLRKNPRGITQTLADNNVHLSKPPLWIKPLIFVWRPISYIDEQWYLGYMDKVVQAAQTPYRDIVPELRTGEGPEFPRYAMVATIVCPVFSRALAARDNAAAELSGSRITLALAAHKARFGAYPASLDQLRSRLGWDIPEDPFSGADFIYTRQASGCLLYSLGKDLKDDKARIYDNQLTGPYDDANPDANRHEYRTANGKYADDIIWQMDH